MSILTDEQLDELSREMVKGNKSVNWLASKIEAAVIEAQGKQEPNNNGWRDGFPPFPQDQKWFIAETKHGECAVLRALPEEYAYDYTTVDDTYFKKVVIKRWKPLPKDNLYAAPVVQPGMVTISEAEHEELLEAQGKQEPVGYFSRTEPSSYYPDHIWEEVTGPEFGQPLYAAPVVQQKQGPVAWCKSSELSDARLKQQSFNGWVTKYSDVDMALYAAPVVQPDCRAIANKIVSNLEGRKRVIDLDLEEELVEEIMQEMTETIRAMIAAAEGKK